MLSFSSRLLFMADNTGAFLDTIVFASRTPEAKTPLELVRVSRRKRVYFHSSSRSERVGAPSSGRIAGWVMMSPFRVFFRCRRSKGTWWMRMKSVWFVGLYWGLCRLGNWMNVLGRTVEHFFNGDNQIWWYNKEIWPQYAVKWRICPVQGAIYFGNN